MATNDLVRYQDAAVPLTDAAAAQADNYSAQTALYATHKRIYDLQETLAGMPLANVDGKSGNTIFVTKTSGGEYASLQAAVNAASAGDVVVVGAGSWGEVTLKAGVSLMGLQPPLADEVVLSKLTFAPTSGSAAANTVYVSNLRISSNTDASSLVLGSLTAPVHVTLTGVRVYRNLSSATVPMASCVSAGGDTTTSIYLRDCMFTHEGGQYASTITLLSSSARYLDLNNCIFFNGGRSLDVTGGGVFVASSRFETASTISAVRVAAGRTVTAGNCTVVNTGVGASGIELGNGATCMASNVGFNVSAGAGKAFLLTSGAATLLRTNLVAVPATNTSLTAGITAMALSTI